MPHIYIFSGRCPIHNISCGSHWSYPYWTMQETLLTWYKYSSHQNQRMPRPFTFHAGPLYRGQTRWWHIGCDKWITTCRLCDTLKHGDCPAPFWSYSTLKCHRSSEKQYGRLIKAESLSPRAPWKSRQLRMTKAVLPPVRNPLSRRERSTRQAIVADCLMASIFILSRLRCSEVLRSRSPVSGLLP